jgi:hypothetical protein
MTPTSAAQSVLEQSTDKHIGKGAAGVLCNCWRILCAIKFQWGQDFHTCPDQPWDPPSLLYNGYQFFHGGRVVGAWCLQPTPL